MFLYYDMYLNYTFGGFKSEKDNWNFYYDAVDYDYNSSNRGNK